MKQHALAALDLEVEKFREANREDRETKDTTTTVITEEEDKPPKPLEKKRPGKKQSGYVKPSDKDESTNEVNEKCSKHNVFLYFLASSMT